MKRALLTLAALFTFVIIQFLAPVWLTTSYAASSCSTKSGSAIMDADISVSVHRSDKVTVTATDGFPAGMAVAIFFPDGGYVLGSDSASGTASSTGTATARFHEVLMMLSFTWQVTVCGSGGSASTSSHPACPIYTDGRLNDCTPWETSAVYCLADGSVRIYVPAKPLWQIAFDASPAEIAQVPKQPEHNTLIKSGHGARLYRLTSGELQVNTPELDPTKSDYVFIFQDCAVPS